MTKEFLEKQLNHLDSEISRLNALKKELKREYIKANKEFDIGDKVKFKNRKGEELYGFVDRIKLGYRNELKYELKKVKKDGKPSQITQYNWGNSKLELVEPKTP